VHAQYQTLEKIVVVRFLALLPDGLRFVSCSWDDTARIAYHGLASSN